MRSVLTAWSSSTATQLRAAAAASSSSVVVPSHVWEATTWRPDAGHHPPMVWDPGYSIPWPESHRFAMWKFSDLKDEALASGLVRDQSDFFSPATDTDCFLSEDSPALETAIRKAHDASYVEAFYANALDATLLRRTGFSQRPDHAALVRRTRLEVAGTLLAADLARTFGLACNLAGGTHHAHRNYGAGYTCVNDLAVAALGFLDGGGGDEGPPLEERRCFVVDCDVHQGDGTAEILAATPQARTLSLHCGDNYPFGFSPSAAPHLGRDRSDLDLALPAGSGDDAVLDALRAHLPAFLDHDGDDDDFDRAARSDASGGGQSGAGTQSPRPPRETLCLYDAGADAAADDALGKFDMSPAGLFRRDVFVLEACVRRGIPVATVIGGGYDRDRARLAKRHAIVLHAATFVWRKFAHTLLARRRGRF